MKLYWTGSPIGFAVPSAKQNFKRNPAHYLAPKPEPEPEPEPVVAMNSAQVTLVKGELRGIARAQALSRATVCNMRQNLRFAFAYNVLGIPIVADLLYPFFGLVLSPMIAVAAMSMSSVSVVGNSLRLRGA